MTMNGIDVSKHNGKINWNAVVASEKVKFAIVRVRSTYDDPLEPEENIEP